MNPLATGGLTLAGTQLDGVVIWVCQLLHVTPPPAQVASTIGVGLCMGVHALWTYASRRWPPQAATAAETKAAAAATA